MFNKLLKNWSAKAFCLLVATLLYFVYRMDSFPTKQLVVPLTVVANKNLLPANTPEKNVRIEVKAPAEFIDSIQARDFKAYLDVDMYNEPGDYKVKVSLDISSNVKGIEGVQVAPKPEKVRLILEEKISKSISINPLFTGEPKEDYEVTGFVTQPMELAITGPASVVQSYKDVITLPLSLDEKNESFTEQFLIKDLVTNPLLRVEDVSAINVSVNVLPVPMVRTFNLNQVLFTNVNPFFTLELESPLSVTISGPQNVLKNYQLPASAVHVDCSSLESIGIYTLPYTVHLNDNFVLMSSLPEHVSVKAELAPVDFDKNTDN